MQSESPLVFCYPKPPTNFRPLGCGNLNQSGTPVIKKSAIYGLIFTSISRRGLPSSARETRISRTPHVYICPRPKNNRSVRARENFLFARAKIYEEHGKSRRFHTSKYRLSTRARPSDSRSRKIPNGFAPCSRRANAFAHGTRKSARKSRFFAHHRH